MLIYDARLDFFKLKVLLKFLTGVDKNNTTQFKHPERLH